VTSVGKRRLADRQEREAVRLRRQRLTLAEIGRRLGVATATVLRILRRQGYDGPSCPRGLASASRETRQRIASMGAKAGHAAGTAHKFTPEEVALGRRLASEGAKRMHAEGRGHKFTPEEARKAGRALKRKGPPPPWPERRSGQTRSSRPNDARRAEVARLQAEGLTLAEIGERLGVTRQAVQSMLDRAEADKAR